CVLNLTLYSVSGGRCAPYCRSKEEWSNGPTPYFGAGWVSCYCGVVGASPSCTLRMDPCSLRMDRRAACTRRLAQVGHLRTESRLARRGSVFRTFRISHYRYSARLTRKRTL